MSLPGSPARFTRYVSSVYSLADKLPEKRKWRRRKTKPVWPDAIQPDDIKEDIKLQEGKDG